MAPFHREDLTNGLVLEFHDRSNRYFGDYHRLHLEVVCRIPLEADFPPLSGLEDDVLEQARRAFGDHVEFRRELTRMGVAGADVETTRRRMIEDFMDATGRYLAAPDFAVRFVRSRLEESCKKKRFVPRLI